MTETPATYSSRAASNFDRRLSLSEIEEQFKTAIINAGLLAPEYVEVDGKFHRFSTSGRKGDKSGWYVVNNDSIPSGCFGDFRYDIKRSWRASIGRTLSNAEEIAYAQKIADMTRVHEQNDVKIKAAAREKAKQILTRSTVCQDHPYLTAKGIQAHGIRVYRSALVIPVMFMDITHSLQYIHSNGNKYFLSGGRISGCYHIISDNNVNLESAPVLCIAEGFATAATILEATGYPTVIAFNAGNLAPASKAIRDQFPNTPLILCADDDYATAGNPGLTKAREAASLVGGVLAIPTFTDDRPEKATDFNDMVNISGAAAVRSIIEAALATSPKQLVEPQRNVISVIPTLSDILNPDQAWPDPAPITDDLKPVPRFTEDMLPSPFNDWVMDIAKRQSTPPDYVAVAALTAISIVIGRKVRIYPKRYDDWLVVPNLWSMLVGRPSSGKTPAMREALKPLHKVAELAIEKFRVELTKYKAGLKLRELKVKVTEKKARTALADGDEKLAQQLLVDIVDVPAIPVEPRYIVNDTTIEKLGELLNQNPNGLLLERDELYGWLHTLDREDRSNDRTFFLEASSGDGTYTYDRIGRGTLHIPALCLSIVGGIQPARLAPYVRHAVRGDTADDGLIQRFQLAVYPDTPVFTRVDEIPNLKAQKEVLQIFITLDKLKPQTGNFISLRFNEASQEIFYDWFDNNEAIIRQKNLHPAMESHLIKFRSLIPSLALILELITNPNATCVTEQATTTACSWANYLRLHAERIYSSAINPIPINALAILSKIEDGKLPNPFVFGDIRRGHWGGLNDKTEILMALELLEERGFIRTEVIKVRSIRPSTIYHINPKIFQVQ